MQKPALLLIDSVINFLLGVLLLFFPRVIIENLGIPMVKNAFYPSILGAVLIGISIALYFEWGRKKTNFVGLGTGGAIIINLCGALALSMWLLFGDLAIPLRGRIILWGLVILIIAVALLEIKNTLRSGISR